MRNSFIELIKKLNPVIDSIPREFDSPDKIEAQLDTKLPTEYRSFLEANKTTLKFDSTIGYTPIKPSPWASSKNGMQHLDMLYGLASTKNSLLNKLNTYTDRIPDGCLPIGDAGGGNQILLSTRLGDYGKVYFWNHEEEINEKGNRATGDAGMYLAADSFVDFLERLSVEEDEDDLDDGLESITLRV